MVRELAYKIVYKTVYRGSYSNIELNNVIESNDLSDKDISLLTNIVYGLLQNYWLIRFHLDGKLAKPNKKIDVLIMLGVYEMMFLRVPKYATVNEYVTIAKKFNLDKPVNAILRNFEPRAIPTDDILVMTALKTSHPLWLVKMIAKHYGSERAIKYCEINNLPPHNVARINTLKAKHQDLVDAGFIQSENVDSAYFYNGNIAKLDAFINGLVTIQDESSQCVAPLLNPKPGDIILDMCSAPGSKTTHIAQLMMNKGKIYAYDLHENKINLINNASNRLGVKIIKATAHDSKKLLDIHSEGEFDKILLDAPCSGFGVFRRKPDMKIRDIQASLDEIIELQAQLLETAYKLLKIGGTLVYSTCTLNKNENDKQIEKIIKKYSNIELVESKTIFPNDFNSDGFFIAKLSKV